MHCPKTGSCAQCTHPRPRPCAHCAQATCTAPYRPRVSLHAGRRVSRAGPYRISMSRAATPCRGIKGHTPFAIQKFYRDTELIPHALRAYALPVAIQSCCISTRVGKWAVAHPTSSPAPFLFSFIFFHLLYSL